MPGRDAVVVLAYDTWTDQFGSDPAVIGRQIRLGGLDFTVVGVAPQTFTGMHLVLPPAFIIPIAMSSRLAGAPPATLTEQRSFRYLEVRGRIKSGVSLEQARQEVASIARGLEQTYPDTNRNYGMLVKTAFDARIDERGGAAPTAMMLLTLAFAVLLVACANVAGLLMSRAPAREKEMALRLAIGGSRYRITRQMITESVLLAAGGGALGLAMGYGGVLLLRRLPIISDIGVRLDVRPGSPGDCRGARARRGERVAREPCSGVAGEQGDQPRVHPSLRGARTSSVCRGCGAATDSSRDRSGSRSCC